MLGTSRTRLFFSNSRSSWGTLPIPLISSSNREPSPISPSDTLRALGVVGFHLGKFATLTTVSNTSSTGLSMTWRRLIIAMRFPCRCANCLGSFGKHRDEGPGVKHGMNRGDPIPFDLIPVANKRGADRSVCNHIAQHTYIISVCEHLENINSLDNGMESFERFQIRLWLLKCIDWTAK